MQDRNLRELLASGWKLENAAVTPISRGTSSDAFLVSADQGTYVLRKLRSARQGDWEYQISTALAELGIAPLIICGVSGNPWAEANGCYYNLQEYVYGQRIQGCNGDIVCLAVRETARMHKKLSTLPCTHTSSDRFSLSSLLSACNWEILNCISSECTVQDLQELYTHMIPLDEEKQQWIHGDLGTWNMLYEKGRIRIIDFGECRMGSVYFDAAAVVTSLLSAIDDPAACVEYIRMFLKTYEENYVPLHWKKLLEYIQLWYARGILVNTTPENYLPGKSEKMIVYFQNQAKKYKNLQI